MTTSNVFLLFLEKLSWRSLSSPQPDCVVINKQLTFVNGVEAGRRQARGPSFSFRHSLSGEKRGEGGIATKSYLDILKPAPLICASTSSKVDQLKSPGMVCFKAAKAFPYFTPFSASPVK